MFKKLKINLRLMFGLMGIVSLISMGVNARGAEQDFVPQRIVSLGSYLTEGLFLLGVGDDIVGVTTYCNRPEQAKLKEKAGSIVEVNIEKVLSLKPDLILTTPLTNAKAKSKLKQMGLNVVDFEQVKDFSQICEQFIKLGKTVNKSDKAKQIVEQAQVKVKALQQSISDKPLQKVFVQVGTKPLFTMNNEFFVNDMIKLAGGINIAENAPTGIYSREKVVELNPDIIIIASMGIAAEDEKQIWNRYTTITAVKNKRIYCIDPDIICNPIPDNFVSTLKMIIDFLHKENLDVN
ncbi:MAG: ABC transporter substrate-binding protein [Candidatus Omnitrophica bacterium]|nr:ABC transporter substrate-binding protein [Candidatus Omnitrophota bacterium]